MKFFKFFIWIFFIWYLGGIEGRLVVVVNRIWRGDCGKLMVNEGDYRNIVEFYGGRIRYFIVILLKLFEILFIFFFVIYNDCFYIELVVWDKGWNLMINVKVDV